MAVSLQRSNCAVRRDYGQIMCMYLQGAISFHSDQVTLSERPGASGARRAATASCTPVANIRIAAALLLLLCSA